MKCEASINIQMAMIHNLHLDSDGNIHVSFYYITNEIPGEVSHAAIKLVFHRCL